MTLMIKTQTLRDRLREGDADCIKAADIMGTFAGMLDALELITADGSVDDITVTKINGIIRGVML